MHSPETDQEREGRQFATGIEEHIQSFSNYLRGLCKAEGTIKQYVSDIKGWWAWWGRPLFLFDINAWDAWTSWQAEQGYKGLTIRMHQMGVRRFFKWLLRKKLVDHNPADLAESVEIADRYPEVLTQEEVERMRRIPRTARTRALFALLYDCGLRNSEARRLPASHVRADHVKVIGKRNRERKVPLVPETKAVLDAWMRVKPESEHLFPTAGGTPVRMEYMCKQVKYWAKAAGIERRITAHTLRHSIATHLIQRGMHIEEVQEFMGHKSIETTRIYVHVAQTTLQSSILKFHPSRQK